jgi:hypothetical protein
MLVNEHLKVTTNVAVVNSRVGATAVLLSVFLENRFKTSAARKSLVWLL